MVPRRPAHTLPLDLHGRINLDRAASRAFLRSAGNVQRDPRGDRFAGPLRLRFRLRADRRPCKSTGPSPVDSRRVRSDAGSSSGRSSDVQGSDVRHDGRLGDLGLWRRQPASHGPFGRERGRARTRRLCGGRSCVRPARRFSGPRRGANRRGWKATARLHVQVE